MAGSDYYRCDLCGRKTFYDAKVDYDPERIGDMKVICTNCAKTHKCIVVKKEAPVPNPSDHPALDAYNSATAYGQPHRLKNAVIELADAMRDELLARIAALEAELEIERGRLAACGVAALGYFDGCQDEYRSASLEDVLKLRSDFDAERGKRCGTCGYAEDAAVAGGKNELVDPGTAVYSCRNGVCWCREAPDMNPSWFGCSLHEPAEQGGKS